MARILLNSLNHPEDGLLPQIQCRFRPRRSPADKTFAARQFQKKCQEQNVDLYTNFVDLAKAFDTVCRKRLWEIMTKFGCSAKFITMIRQFHDGMQASVQDDEVYSEPFPVTSGVKQCCVLVPTLFSMMFSAMLTGAFRFVDIKVELRFRTDENCSTYVGFRQKTKFWMTLPATFSLLTTAH